MADGRTYLATLVQLLAADTTRTLIAAPGTGGTEAYLPAIRVHRIIYLSETANASAVTVACGATELCLITNLAANSIFDTGLIEPGIICPSETALIATPAAAGPAGKFFVIYSIDNV